MSGGQTGVNIMTTFKSALRYMAFRGLLAGVTVWTLSFTGVAAAQSLRTIDAGTTITVRTNEQINSSNSDGRVFSGIVEQDVMNRGGNVAIPRGSNVELLVKNMSNNQIALDLDSVTVDGQRYGIQSGDSVVDSQSDGLGVNKRTGTFVGAGAAIGAIIGAIAGGGKGAAIGGGIGAAGGAGTQILTRGRRVNVPAESLVTFRLEQPLQTGAADYGFSRNGQHYHPGIRTQSGNSAAYQAGLQAGRSDFDRGLKRNAQTSRWASGQQLREYQAGYSSGYDRNSNSGQQENGSIRIASNHNISWQGPANSSVYVRVDDNPRQLFAGGASGTQLAPWMTSGHLYVFVLQDSRGNEIARDESDLRQRRSNLSR
jgi:hypothetical protein